MPKGENSFLGQQEGTGQTRRYLELHRNRACLSCYPEGWHGAWQAKVLSVQGRLSHWAEPPRHSAS